MRERAIATLTTLDPTARTVELSLILLPSETTKPVSAEPFKTSNSGQYLFVPSPHSSLSTMVPVPLTSCSLRWQCHTRSSFPLLHRSRAEKRATA